MANIQAWQDVKPIEKYNKGIKESLDAFKYIFGMYHGLKNDIQFSTDRTAQLVALLNEHPSLTLVKILSDFNKYKQLYDWLVANGF